MEEKEIIKIIGALIGLLIFGCGLYYLVKEKEDKESRTIYTITTIVGAVIAIGALIFLLV